MNYPAHKQELNALGYSQLNALYTDSEIESIFNILSNTEEKGKSILKTKDVFAIRQLIFHFPELKTLLFNDQLLELLAELFRTPCFLSKAIYFDKPKESNWFVGYHQDLSISVDQKIKVVDYQNWTFKHGQFGVQPPRSILDNTITVRIHLDETNAENGALKVIPKSHLKGIQRLDGGNWNNHPEHSCDIEKGGVMLMKPLTFHASNRTTNNKRRRVIHLEFCNQELATPLKWLERSEINIAPYLS